MGSSDSQGWEIVDAYLEERLGTDEPLLKGVLAANRAAGLQQIDVSPLQGRFLALMLRVRGAKRVLEIGTLGGYSTICMARALGDGGDITTLEIDPATADFARSNIDNAGLSDRINVITGAALDILPTLEGPFDLVFIDADKRNNAAYLDWAVKLSGPGTVIIVDNVIRSGGIVDASKTDPHTGGTRAMFEAMKDYPQLEVTALQTVGSKGWDGFMMAVVK